MAIGLQKLSAGSGYAYLTSQVAAMDETGRGHTTLADYYSDKGESPGRWCGHGLVGVGLTDGEVVTEEQMKLLFGAGLNPTTGERLGRRYGVYANEPTPFETELARRLSAGRAPRGATVPREVRTRVRTELAQEWFVRAHGRPPSGPRELHGFIAKSTSHPRTSVAGFDATFTPPKSVSVLWAVAPPELAATIRSAHEAAVADAIAAVERRVAFTRQGHDGARHIEVRGVLAAVFVHRDSRAGDPNLHSHVALANKVQTSAGDWLALDAQVLYRAKVTLSEEYTTSLQARLTELGLAFVPTRREGRRPVYEVAGVDPRLVARWSFRRLQVTVRTGELVAQFQADHERPPTPAERLELAQQATLDTRQAKHHPRSEGEQRAGWRADAERILGPGGTARMVATILSRPRSSAPVVDTVMVERMAARVIGVVQAERSSWTAWHVRSEALRHVRATGVGLEHLDDVVERVVQHALSLQLSIPIRTTRSEPVEPDLLRRSDGQSVYAQPAGGHYTSARILGAERRLLDAAGRHGGRTADANSVTLALLQSMANHEPLNTGQQLLVHDMATSGRRLQLAIAPAGSGKTTAMRALACAWTTSGGNVLGLAPSAAAAEQLRQQLGAGAAADTLAKLVWAIGQRESIAEQVGPGTLVIIDEAGMADTLTLDHVVNWCLDRGASVRLVGDDQQLGAIGAGGVLRDIAATHGALHLDQVVRFTDPAEADASLALRTGDAGALGFYLDRERVHAVDPATATSQVLAAWRSDTAAGLDAVMLAPTRQQVAELNAAARTARLGGRRPGLQVNLSDGNQAGVGDVVLTRRNNRTLTTGGPLWVRNGDRWRVTDVHRDGSIDVQHLRQRNRLTLPADYVAESVELGYATTIHAAQGVTADTCHGLLTGTESRQLAYTMLTRGRHANHAWVQVNDEEAHVAPVDTDLLQPPTATQVLEAVLARDDAPASATTLLSQADGPERLLGPAVTCYLDAVGFAAEHHLDQATKDAIDTAGRWYGLTGADAWPALRSHLMLVAADDRDHARALARAVALGGLDDARDCAAVIDHRLDRRYAIGEAAGPLPWLPGIPKQFLDDPRWGTYLNARHQLARTLGEEVHDHAAHGAQRPRWAEHLPGLDAQLVADIQVWRAAHDIPETDLRPTGPSRHSPAERETQDRLDRALETSQAGIREWLPKIIQAAPATAGDPALPTVAASLAAADRDGYHIDRFLVTAASSGPLPDDHPADALQYRVTALIQEWNRIAMGQADEAARNRPRSPKPPPPSMSRPGRGRARGISI